MPTLSELRVRAAYDGKQLKAGLNESRADMADAAKDMVAKATEGEKAIAAAAGRAASAQKQIPVAAKKASDEVAKAQTEAHQRLANEIEAASDRAAASVKASTTKMGASYAQLPAAARRAYDQAAEAQREYQAKVTQGMQNVGVALSASITVPFALFAKGSTELAAEFEQTMDVLQVSIEGTARDMANLQQKAVELGNDLTLPATSAVDASRAMTLLAKGGLNVRDVMEASRGTMQLAAAAGIESAEAATIQARALSAFGLAGSEATHVADLLAKATYSATGTVQDMGYALQAAGAVMRTAGQSIDDTVSAITLLAKAGVVGSDAGTSLKSMFLRLEEGGSVKRVRDLLHGYGIEVYDAAGRMKDMRGIIAEFAPMFDHLTEKQRNSALATIFGSDAVRAANIILGEGVAAFDAMREKLDQEGAAAELAAARNKGLKGALDALGSAFETLQQQSAEGLLRPLAGAVREVAQVVGALGQMDPAARSALLGFSALTAAAGPLLIVAAQLKTAWGTLFAARAAATIAATAQAAADAAVVTAQQAQAVTAAEAAAAETALATATTASGTAAAAATVEKAAAAVANQAIATTATAATAATMATTAATGTAAASTGLLAGAMAALTGPVGLAVLGIAALSAAVYGLYKWSQMEADQARENEKAFRTEAQATQESAKAKVELAKQLRPLLSEYEALQKKQEKTNAESARYQDLANKISELAPDLVQSYRSTGDAILDVAKAHQEAAAQAQNQYDKELALANARLRIIDMGDAAQRASSLREQGAGKSLSQLQNSVKVTNGSLVEWDRSVWGDDPSGPAFQAAKDKALAEKKVSMGTGSRSEVAAAERALVTSLNELNIALRKAESEAAAAKRDAADSQQKAKLGPAGYAEFQAKQARAREQSEWQAEAKKRADDLAYQKRKDAWFKSQGYSGIDELAEVSKPRAKAKAKEATITDDLLEAMARKVSTPEGQASCGFLAMAILKQTGAEIGKAGYGGGAQDLVRRVKAAGGVEVSASQARPGDLVYYNGPQYGAKRPGGQRSGYHVGIYEGDGYVIDSSGTGPGNVRTRQPVRADANFIRPMRSGPFGTAGEIGLREVEQAEKDAAKRAEDAKRATEKQAQAAKDLAEAFKRQHIALASLTDPNARYAELLGVTLDKYKQLAPEERARVERLAAMRSSTLAAAELTKAQREQAAGRIADPTDRAVQQYANTLADRKDLSEADRGRLIEQKRAELTESRADAIAKEVSSLALEVQLAEAITEQERIRLRLIMSRPDLKPGELDTLAAAEYAKFQAEQQRGVRGELVGIHGSTLAAEAQAGHNRAVAAIQTNIKLTEEQRYKLIEDQNDALTKQLYLLEQQARVQKGDITGEQAEQLNHAQELYVQKQRAARDEVRAADQITRAQSIQADNLEKRMSDQQDLAKNQAGRLVDILVKPMQDGMDRGVKGVWRSLMDGWRQTIRQMAMEWAKSQLSKAIEPMFEGQKLRQYKAAQAAKGREQAAEQAKLIQEQVQSESLAVTAAGAAKITAGESNGVPNGGKYGQMAKLDPAGIIASLALLTQKKGGILGELAGFAGLLHSTGAFGKKGYLAGLKFAAGGDMPYGQPALVGEFGPEIWTPPSSGGVIHTAQETSRMLNTAPQITVVQNITTPDTRGFKVSGRQIASDAFGSMARQGRRNFKAG